MNKIFFLSLLLFLLQLNAKEPTLAILKSVKSNTQQLFSISNSTYLCKAYGVIGMEELLQDAQLNQTCREAIKKFYKKNPKAKYFSEFKLKTMQTYHLEFKQNECVLFVNGEVTLSELLLNEGAVVLQRGFKGKEYTYHYTLAQENARMQRKGVFKESIIRDCIAEIYKK